VAAVRPARSVGACRGRPLAAPGVPATHARRRHGDNMKSICWPRRCMHADPPRASVARQPWRDRWPRRVSAPCAARRAAHGQWHAARDARRVTRGAWRTAHRTRPVASGAPHVASGVPPVAHGGRRRTGRGASVGVGTSIALLPPVRRGICFFRGACLENHNSITCAEGSALAGRYRRPVVQTRRRQRPTPPTGVLPRAYPLASTDLHAEWIAADALPPSVSFGSATRCGDPLQEHVEPSDKDPTKSYSISAEDQSGAMTKGAEAPCAVATRS